MKVTGTVEFVDLEGGLYRLSADDGKRYQLIGSRGELKSVKGARVEVEGAVDEGFGIGMSGPQLRVSRIRKL
jgi:formylmethanofuran dehydrogenase subunit C